MNLQVRVALAQINSTVGDLEGNCQKILHYIREAEQAGADLVIFPELATKKQAYLWTAYLSFYNRLTMLNFWSDTWTPPAASFSRLTDMSS